MNRFIAVLVLVLGVFNFSYAPAQAQSVCPDDFLAYADSTAPVTCSCDADAIERNSVWGTDIYSGDSGVCRAALHVGAIGKKGGVVTVYPLAGQSRYVGTTRNGITSYNFESYASSFAFGPVAAAPLAQSAPPVPAPAPAPTPSVTPPPAPVSVPYSGVCPDDFLAFADTTSPVNCGCDAAAIERGSVWGTDIYSGDSGVCRSALHANVVGKKGGNVTVYPLPGQPRYVGTTRNDVTSYNFGDYPSSFGFAPAGGPVASTSAPANVPPSPPVVAHSGVCPDDFLAFANTTTPLTCSCDTAATERGSVWGMDIYTGDSGVCRAALHAGIVSAQGGNVTITPLAGQSRYVGVTRNGVTSYNFGDYPSSFSVASVGSPFQAPVAQTLQTTGQVQLYINFAFNSAEVLPSSTPVLNELLAALQANPGLRLNLVGHTDAIGAADYNMMLSALRAQSVAMWLVSRGVDSSRLATSGRGFYEPLADNGTEYGRALNRRVQAIKM